jgi:hypothetical protein
MKIILFMHLFVGTEETHRNDSHDSWSAGRELKPGLPKYDTEMVITQPKHSVDKHSEEV